MRRLILAAFAVLASVCLYATAPATTVVSYTCALSSTTPPRTPPMATATVTWSATASPSYLNIPLPPASYDPITGVLTWTLPQNSQVHFDVPKAVPAISGTYALGTSSTYSLNSLVPVSSPQTAPTWTASFMPLLGGIFTGSVGYPLVAKTADYVATASDSTITGNATAAPFKVTLPTAVGCTGRIYTVKKTDASANVLTVYAAAGEFIDGDSTWPLVLDGEFVSCQSNGTGWVTVGAQKDPRLPASGTLGNYLSSTGSAWVSSTPPWLTAETDPSVYAWAKAATKPSYTYTEVGAAPAVAGVPTPANPADNAKVLTASAGTAGWAAAPAEADTLASVTGRGATTTNAITTGAHTIQTPDASGDENLVLKGVNAAASFLPGVISTQDPTNIGDFTWAYHSGPWFGQTDPCLFWGYNVNPGPTLRNNANGQAALYYGIEGDYKQNDTEHTLETYIQYTANNGTTHYRPFGVNVNRTTAAVASAFAVDSIVFSDKVGTGVWANLRPTAFQIGGPAYSTPIQIGYNNASGFWQLDAAGTAYKSLFYLNSTDTTVVGSGDTVQANGNTSIVTTDKASYGLSVRGKDDATTSTFAVTDAAGTSPYFQVNRFGTITHQSPSTYASGCIFNLTSNLGSTTHTMTATVGNTGAFVLSNPDGAVYIDYKSNVYFRDLNNSGTTNLQVAATGTYAPKTTVTGDFGEAWIHGKTTELITLSTTGTTTDSSANLLPANSIIEAVVARVTTSITTATDWALGDGTIATRFSSANATMTAGTTAVGFNHVEGTGTSGKIQVSAAKLRITTTGTPGAGVIRVTVFYRQFTAPTS